MTVPILFVFLTRYDEPITDDQKDDFYTSTPCLTCLFMLWWWCHNWLSNAGADVMIDWQIIMWLGNGEASMWKVVSNSSDIDFIHSDIHCQSCNKYKYVLSIYWFWLVGLVMYIWIFNSWLVVQIFLFKLCIYCTVILCNLSEVIKWYFSHICAFKSSLHGACIKWFLAQWPNYCWDIFEVILHMKSSHNK